MPGGLLNLIAVGQQNIILNGTPKKTFWKTSYSKYTNFGMQKFRLDFNGSRKLRLNDRSTFTFKYPRYGDLVMDTYLVVNLPHIWSPLYPIKDNSNHDPEKCNTFYIPYNHFVIDCRFHLCLLLEVIRLNLQSDRLVEVQAFD